MPDRPERLDLDRLCRAIDRLPSILAYWDRQLVCRFANRAYETWFGVNPDGLRGKSLRSLLGPQLFELNRQHIEAALRGEQQTFERIVPGPGGVQRHSLALYVPDIVDGQVQGFIAQVTEITQLKETQAALRRESALLHERDETLAVLAHEVRQPLHNAAAVLQSAAATLASSGQPRSVAQIQRAQSVLGQVLASVDNTLATATLVGRSEPIQGLLADIEMLVQIAIGDMPAEQRHRVGISFATATRNAVLDTNLMRLALRNLLANALRHAPEGSPVTVRVSSGGTPPALLLDVVDSGPGIDAALAPTVFERGTRGRSPTGAPGHGVGLYLVRRVMELHRGSVSLVRNGPDGVTMRLFVPQ